MNSPVAVKNSRPSEIILHQLSGVLELKFEPSDQSSVQLSAEYLRINSPSAEVQGHSANEKILVDGKKAVRISAIHPVGNYAILIEFSDGHRTGIYSFVYLLELAEQYPARWSSYLEQLQSAGKSREAERV